MKKRAFSLILALALCLGLLPTAALAAEITPTVAIPFQYEDALGFSEGLVAVEIDTGEKNQYGNPICKWGYIDKTGKTVIPFQYDGATDFSEGWAAVKKGNYWGYIDKTGKEMIVRYDINTGERDVKASYPYDKAMPFSQGLAAVYDRGCWHYIDTTGAKKIVRKLQKGDTYAAGETIGFAEALEFGPEGYAQVERQKPRVGKLRRVVLIDKTGEDAPFTANYQSTFNFSDGLAVVLAKEGEVHPYEMNSTIFRHGYIDQNGNQVIPCQYLNAGPFSEGRAMVSDEWLSTGRGPQTYADGSIGAVMSYGYKLIDKTGKALTPAKYSGYRPFSEGFMAVGVDFTTAITPERWGFIDLTGKEIVPCEYDEVKDFSQGLAAVRRSGRWGFVDKTGQEVIPCQYEGATSFSDGMAAVKKEEKWGFISVDGYVAPNASQPPALIAYPSTLTVSVDGRPVQFHCYALKDKNGGLTNYVSIRELAMAFQGTKLQCDVKWEDGSVRLYPEQAYQPTGTEGSTPFTGERVCKKLHTTLDKMSPMWDDLPGWFVSASPWVETLILTDDNGGGYTYYQLRDLGKGLRFNVGWSADRGIFVETDKPYDQSN